MKKAIVFLCLSLASFFVYANNYTRVTGIGNTFEEAKLKAFQIAIQSKVGSVIASEREISNLNLIRDDIVVYSAGYVDDYKLISQTYENQKVKVVLDVLVSSSKIANRLLSQSKSAKEFDGDKNFTRYDTFIKEKNDSDRIFQVILNDYPFKAYDIEQKPYSLKIDAYRNAVIAIPFELRFNKHYIRSLAEMLNILQDGNTSWNARPIGNVVMTGAGAGSWLTGKAHFKFNDVKLIENVQGTFGSQQNALRIKLTIKDKYNNVILENWYIPRSFYGENFYAISKDDLYIHGESVEKNLIRVVIPSDSAEYAMLRDIDKIELSIDRWANSRKENIWLNQDK